MDDFGFGVAAGISPADNARLTTLENNEYKVTYYEIISGTSGSLTVPSQATINAGEFGLSGNAILSKIDGSNKPTFESPKTSGGTIVTASLNISTGVWTASGTYTDANVALIYSIKIKAIYYSNLNYNNIIETASVGVVTETATQTLTNKTVNAGIFSTSANMSYATASSTPIFNASKNIVSSITVDLSATLTINGWSVFTTKKIIKIDCGSYNAWDILLDGTSDSTTTTVDLVDITSALSSSNYKAIVVVDNGGAVSATGVSILTPGGSLITFYRNLSQNNFTASGRKLVVVQLIQMK